MSNRLVQLPLSMISTFPFFLVYHAVFLLAKNTNKARFTVKFTKDGVNTSNSKTLDYLSQKEIELNKVYYPCILGHFWKISGNVVPIHASIVGKQTDHRKHVRSPKF